MKKVILLFVLTVIFSTSFSQSPGIIGAYWNGACEMLSEFDPFSEVFSDIDTLSGVSSVQSGESAYDMTNGDFYFLSNMGITAFNSLTGAFVDTFANAAFIRGMEFDTVSKLLYGAYYMGTKASFISVDMSTKTINVIIDSIPGVDNVYLGESTFDQANRLYYRKSNLGILQIDVISGAVTDTISSNSLIGIEYDPVDDKIFGLFWAGTAEMSGSIDVSSEVFTPLDTVINVGSVSSGSSSLDWFSRRYVTRTDLGITIVDLDSGVLIDSNNTLTNFCIIEYSLRDYLISGIKEQEEDNVIIYPDPASNKIFISGLSGSNNIVSIYNLSGQIQKQVINLQNNAALDISGLSSGVYIISVSRADTKPESFKIVVNNTR